MKLAQLAIVLFALACGTSNESVQRTTFWTEAPELFEYVEAMTVRIARATGRSDVSMSPGGIPVVVNDHPQDVAGQETCATTSIYASGAVLRIDVDLDPPLWANGAAKCMGLPATLVHEGFHALAPDVDHAPEGPHLFALHANAMSRIDDVSLQVFCSEFDCHEFVPE
jgi:hypothetical protein